MPESTSSALLTGSFGYALASITGLLTANGGAAAVILSLIGSVWGQKPEVGQVLAAKLSGPLWYFGVGMALAILTAMASYVSQGIINHGARPWIWRSSQVIACAIALSSLGFFVFGMWQASGLAPGLQS